LSAIFVVPVLSRANFEKAVAMVPKRDFTDRFLRSIRPAEPGKRVIFYDAQIPGFGIRVTDRSAPDYKGSFVLVTRYPGSNNPTPRRIGDYPAMSLAKAREIAREWREDIRRGLDPKLKEADQRRQEARRRADTVDATFATFAADHLSTPRTGAEVKRAIEQHVLPRWGERPISEIRRADVAELVRGLRKDAPIRANRVLAYLKKFFGWLVDQDMIEASPAAAVKPPSKEIRRDRVLTDLEIRAIWQASSELGAFGRAFKLMLATGQRRSEVGAMAWCELNRQQAVWTLPRERTKADRAHEVPLSGLAVSIIEDSPRLGDFIFSTGRGAPTRNGETRAGEPSWARPISGWSKAKAALDKLAAEKATVLAAEQKELISPTFEDWHVHDLRRTVATNLAKLGVDRVVIGKVLNHAENEVTAVYAALETQELIELHTVEPRSNLSLDPRFKSISSEKKGHKRANDGHQVAHAFAIHL
jgi:integrase